MKQPLFNVDKTIASTKIKVLILGNPDKLVDARIIEQNKLEFVGMDGKKKKIFIYHPPRVMEFVHGRWIFKTKKRYHVFYTTPRSEATHDPTSAALDLPTVEMANKYIISLIESDVPVAMTKSVNIAKGWLELIPYFLILIGPLVMAWLFLQGGG